MALLAWTIPVVLAKRQVSMMPHQDLSMRRNLPVTLALPLLAILALAPFASAQSGGTGVEPVDGVAAEVQYVLENATSPPPEDNGTDPPGNETPPPEGNETTPPGGNETTPPGGNETVPPDGNETTPPGDNETVPPDENETVPPDENETIPPDENETAPPEENETSPPDGNETAPPEGNETVPADGNGTTAEGGSTLPPEDGTTNSTDDADCTACIEANVSLSDLGSDDDGSNGGLLCAGIDCQRTRPTTLTPERGGAFPWLPLLITLIVAPLVGLIVARLAIKRWLIAKPPPKAFGPARPSYDPMREFMRDVKEWKAMPAPGAEPTPST